MSSGKRKRTIDQENRQFNDTWTGEFLMVAHHSGGMLCLECSDVIKTTKRSNAKAHFDVKHGSTYAGMTMEFRKERVEKLKNSRHRQQSMMRGPTDQNKKAVLASAQIAYALNKKGEITICLLSFLLAVTISIVRFFL